MSGDRFEWVTQALGSCAASADVLDTLTGKQLVVLAEHRLGASFELIARRLGVTKQGAHRLYQRALVKLGLRARNPRVDGPDRRIRRRAAYMRAYRSARGITRPYRCPLHGRDCEETCSYLRRWLSRIPASE